MNNDSELIERIIEGNRAAFDTFYKQYYFSIRAYARLLLHEGEAEDVVQDDNNTLVATTRQNSPVPRWIASSLSSSQ